MTNTNITLKTLEVVKENFNSDIAQFVISDLEQHGNNWYTYLLDVLNHGCQSGTVSSLIYYTDTEAFHDQYEDEIDNMVHDLLDDTGMEFSQLASKIDVWDIQQLKNWKAWFAYEEMCGRISNEVENGTYENIEEEQGE